MPSLAWGSPSSCPYRNGPELAQGFVSGVSVEDINEIVSRIGAS